MYLYGQTVSNAAHFPVDEDTKKNSPHFLLDNTHT